MRYQSAATVFTVFSLYTTGALASNRSDIQELKQRVDSLEARAACAETLSPDFGDDASFYFWGEGLYWKASEGGLPYVNKSVADSLTGDTVVSKIKHVPFNWHWGFRVGAGYSMCHDSWNIYATYTRYHFKENKTASLGPDRDPTLLGLPSLYVFWFPAASGPYNSISSHWRVHLDQGDLQLGREFYVTDALSLTPHLGLRTAWIRQKFAFDARSLVTGEFLLDFDAKSNFWGIGIVGGLDTAWKLDCGLSIYGGVALSVLDGHFETPFDYTTILDDVLVTQLTNSTHQNMAVVFADLDIGLRYDGRFWCERFHWAIWAGYEQHVYFEQNQFLNTEYTSLGIPFSSGSNLSTNGITVGLELGF